MNIWYGTNENAKFSNLACRPFKFEGNHYVSVEHAYQTNKSGMFDREIYIKPWLGGSKFMGKRTNTFDNWNIKLMEELIKASFEQNPEALEDLINTKNAVFTHLQDRGIWREMFPKLLTKVREQLKEDI